MNMKRMRGRNHRPNGGGGGGGGFRNQQNGIPLNRNHVFDSSGPEMRVRGTAQQLYDKYQQLARDASSNGDRVTGEAYYQHAEHYFRIISAINQAQGQPTQSPNGANNGPNNGQERAPYQPQNNGHNEYQRRDQANGENDSQGDSRPQETREFREPRNQERRFEQRPYEPRPKPEFQRNERNERSEPRYRPEPVIDARIDISSALEAELAAATAEPPGFGEQPAMPNTVEASPQHAEPRAIPIIPDAPPAADAEAAAPRAPRPRGRPRKVAAEEAPVEE
jgi:hypothetical protein